MTDPLDALGTLRSRAAAYAKVALDTIGREFPGDAWHTWRAPDDAPQRPRERTPVFWGSYDWHSSVEMHWVLVRLLRMVPNAFAASNARAVLEARFGAAALAREAVFIADADNRNRERPYGWGWALALAHELEALDDPDGRRWRARCGPLVDALEANFLDWLPRATYPVRHGVHSNSAFGIGLALPHAEARAAAGDARLRDALVAAAHRWFDGDVAAPGGWEPSGCDFLSPTLAEAELMSRLLTPGHFSAWLGQFLPGLADGQPVALFRPAIVSDATDGQIAHLHGLNLSRAWCWRRIAEVLPRDDRRVPVLAEAARIHAAVGLPHVVGGDYMVEHWLAAYAVLLLS
ncbi:MAG: DUF2891 domain-containing protein [Chloroflexota bacterium]